MGYGERGIEDSGKGERGEGEVWYNSLCGIVGLIWGKGIRDTGKGGGIHTITRNNVSKRNRFPAYVDTT